MNNAEIRAAVLWLKDNGHREDINILLGNLRNILMLAIDKNYHPDKQEWKGKLRHACNQIYMLDKAYFEIHQKHFIKKFNKESVDKMSDYLVGFLAALTESEPKN